MDRPSMNRLLGQAYSFPTQSTFRPRKTVGQISPHYIRIATGTSGSRVLRIASAHSSRVTGSCACSCMGNGTLSCTCVPLWMNECVRITHSIWNWVLTTHSIPRGRGLHNSPWLRPARYETWIAAALPLLLLGDDCSQVCEHILRSRVKSQGIEMASHMSLLNFTSTFIARGCS